MPVIFVLDIFQQFLGTTAYSLGVTNAVPMLKGVGLSPERLTNHCMRQTPALIEQP
ncbi:MAG TPA: hypothetical protein VLQ80_07925 [Candidatus Saccharimonadia bacterium]|nr:hypothetical protein [Candidatus Saccharimonadia bacterium]